MRRRADEHSRRGAEPGAEWSGSVLNAIVARQIAALSVTHFVPTDIAGCRVWLRADLGVTLNGATVSAWANQADAAFLASVAQAVAANQPTFLASGINGLPSVVWDGALKWLTGTYAADLTQPCDYFVVLRPTAIAGLLVVTSTDNAAKLHQSNLTVIGGVDHKFGWYGGIGITSGAGAWTVDENFVLNIHAEGASTVIYKNGASFYTANGGALVSSGLKLGIYVDSAQFPFVGWLSEVVVIDGGATAAERALLQTYFDGRYGL